MNLANMKKMFPPHNQRQKIKTLRLQLLPIISEKSLKQLIMLKASNGIIT